MSGFRELKEASNNFETELKEISACLFSVNVGEDFDTKLSKKLENLSLYRSKLRFLQAKQSSLTTQPIEQDKDRSTVITEYGDTVLWKVIEQQFVKSTLQSNAVRKLVTEADDKLSPEMVDRKRKIIAQLNQYAYCESQLRVISETLTEKENQLWALREEWDKELGQLRDVTQCVEDASVLEETGPLYKSLKIYMQKIELTRLVINKLVVSRSRGYDWLIDSGKHLNALKLARKPCTVDDFTQSL